MNDMYGSGFQLLYQTQTAYSQCALNFNLISFNARIPIFRYLAKSIRSWLDVIVCLLVFIGLTVCLCADL